MSTPVSKIQTKVMRYENSQNTPTLSILSWEIAAMLAKVVVVGVRRIVARGAQDLTN